MISGLLLVPALVLYFICGSVVSGLAVRFKICADPDENPTADAFIPIGVLWPLAVVFWCVRTAVAKGVVTPTEQLMILIFDKARGKKAPTIPPATIRRAP